MDPNELPIYRHETEILDALARHRVVVIEGPTGSGKTTQLPKILLRHGLSSGLIGVTQPRRIAAVSVAWRIAEESGVELGREVGYAIRFDDRTSEDTLVKIMTDGILLQEARTDPLFSRYGVIVVDEAHERTLNIDFTLGLLHRALEQRDDLRVIVSSATLLPETFQAYFDDIAGGDVPLVSIDARPYPVEMMWRPTAGDGPEATMDAVAEEVMKIHRGGTPGAVLVFLTGEAMIKGTRELLLMQPGGRDLEVVPLYGKLTREEQERVFMQFPGKRKVILATNIAETSITVSDVRFVIDSGLAKVPRVHNKTGIVTLREEGISRASAEQRAGRAGRTAAGRAVRLYSRKAFAARPEYTDEEILRLDLSDVALRLINLGVRDIEEFPLPTPPPPRALASAIKALQAMGAIDGQRNLTSIGERMVPFPLSPALARMVVEAADRFPKVVDEVLMVGAFMSARSPYLYPQGEEREARRAQEQLAHPLGDATTAVVTLRRYLHSRNPDGFCRASYLDPDIMAFIAKAHRQLSDIAAQQGIEIASGGDPSGVVRSVAVGFARQIMRREGRLYAGPGDTAIAIHPSSSLFGARARYVVAADIVIAARAYARSVSLLRPEWIAEANRELAARWDLLGRRRRGRHDDDAPSEELPSELQLGEVTLPVLLKRGQPSLRIPIELAPRLTEVSLSALPDRALRWKAQLEDDRFRWGRAAPLGALLCLLPHLPLPEGQPRPFRDVPLGALLETDRNLHTLTRFLGQVLEPGLPPKGKHPGWLALGSNGESGFWFEVVSDYPEAVGATLEAMRDLAHALPTEDPLHATVDAKVDALEDHIIHVANAVEAGRRYRRKRRWRP